MENFAISNEYGYCLYFCNDWKIFIRNENCQCWEEVNQNLCKDVIDQKCKYDIGGICNTGPYLEYTEPTGYFCQKLECSFINLRNFDNVLTLTLAPMNVSVTRSPALMMDTAAQSMEESAMRLVPLQIITPRIICATSNKPLDYLTSTF